MNVGLTLSPRKDRLQGGLNETSSAGGVSIKPHRRGGVPMKIWGRKYTAEETTRDFFLRPVGISMKRVLVCIAPCDNECYQGARGMKKWVLQGLEMLTRALGTCIEGYEG